MVWAINWFVYDPGTRLVHQEGRFYALKPAKLVTSDEW